MTDKNKMEYEVLPKSTIITEQLSIPSLDLCSGEKGEIHSNDNGGNSFNNYDLGVYSIAKGNFKHVKQYAMDMIQHEKTTIQLNSDGTILIRPDVPQIPNEVVSMIVNYLSGDQKSLGQCALVSTQFYNIANPLLYKTLNFRTTICFERFIASMHDAPAERLATIGKHIQELRMCGPHCTDAHLTRPLHPQSLLKPVTIHPPPETISTCIQQLLLHCSSLTTLEMTFVPLGSLCFDAIGRSCPQLRVFEWRIYPGQSAEWLSMITSCPLQRLHISSIHYSLKPNVIKILLQFHGLTHLNLFDRKYHSSNNLLTLGGGKTNKSTSFSVLDDDDDNSSVDDLLPIHSTITSTRWPQLTSLTLEPCLLVTDTVLIEFLKSHPNIQQLQLMKAPELTDFSFTSISTLLPKLAHFTLTENEYISPQAVQELICGCSALETLKIYYCMVEFSTVIPGLLDDADGWCCLTLLNPLAIDFVRQAVQDHNQQQQRQ